MNRSLVSCVVWASLLFAACAREEGDPGSHQAHPAPGGEHASHGGIPGYAPVQISQDRAQLLNIRTEPLSRMKLEKGLRTVGLVTADETRTSQVHVKFDGFIDQVFADYTGRAVERGQALLTIYSKDLLAAQQDYLVSRAALAKIPEDSASEPVRSTAKELVAAARRRLELFDIPTGVIDKLDRTGVAQKYVTITSPRAGVVLEKRAIAGAAVDPMTPLYVIADLSKVWVVADIYERDLAHVKPGEEAILALDALPGKSLKGVTSFISPTVDEVTRTAKARLEFDNAEGLLKPGMYATVEFRLDLGEGIAVPTDAILDTGERQIVFVAHPGGHFEPRAVTLGPALGDAYQILDGLEEGEEIAVTGQFLLDSESRLRAASSSGGTPSHSGH